MLYSCTQHQNTKINLASIVTLFKITNSLSPPDHHTTSTAQTPSQWHHDISALSANDHFQCKRSNSPPDSQTAAGRPASTAAPAPDRTQSGTYFAAPDGRGTDSGSRCTPPCPSPGATAPDRSAAHRNEPAAGVVPGA